MLSNTSQNNISRRNFLKISGLAAASLVVIKTLHETEAITNAAKWLTLSREPQIEFNNHQVRGTSTGEIFASGDDGKSWQRLISLGTHCAISSLVVQDDQIFAEITHAGHEFWLVSNDGNTWRTAV